jgi:hypothetical protein
LSLGRDTQNFTATSALFLNNPTFLYWQFESVYTVTTTNGVSSGAGAIQFVINSPPANGTCTIDQTNGTTMTLFQIACSGWVDVDGINDYTFYGMYFLIGTSAE